MEPETETDCDYCGDTPVLMNKFKGMLKPKAKVHWGEYLWGFIHTITLNNDLKSVELLKGVTGVIPCDACKEMYINNLTLLNNLDLTEKLVLFHWSVDLHNKVNEKLNKPTITYGEAYDMYFM